MKEIEGLIEELLTDPEANDDGLLGNRILKRFHRGAPLEYLRPLLLSPDERLANLGAWIASELGGQGRPLLSLVGGLLRHPAKKVRFWMLDCVLLWAGPSEAREIAQALRLLGDPEKAVRWKAMVFVFRASREQLESALAVFDAEEPESPNALGLRWLLSDAGRDVEAVESELQSPDAQRRKYAAAAAARMSEEDRRPLLAAASSPDPEVAEFAADRV